MHKTWPRSVLTAILFPIMLLAALAGFDEFSGTDRLPWTKPHHTREQAIRLAEGACFRNYPGYEEFRPWRAKLSDGIWLVRGTQSGLPWIISSRFDTAMVAILNDSSEQVSSCNVVSGA
jgi:hypothetical protein